MVNATRLLEESVEGIISFCLMREHESGGFSAGRYMPATVEDTYHAIRCLELLTTRASGGISNRPTPPAMISPEIHINFLKTKLRQEWNNSRRLFHILYCIRTLAPQALSETEPVVSGLRVRKFLVERIRTMPALDECFFALRTAAMLGNKASLPLDNLRSLTDYSITSVSELRMLLYLAVHSGDGTKPDGLCTRWLPWLQRCLNHDGGYGFFPGTTSYVENVYHAVESFRLMDALPEETAKTAGFIRACRSARGGFGRRCQGVPFPDSTWYAAAVLFYLSNTMQH
jgi:hypothetical protein